MRGAENTLKKFGVDWSLEKRRLDKLSYQERLVELGQQTTSFSYEVVRDEVVSTPYSYHFGPDGELYTNPACTEIYKVTNQFDPEDHERSGIPKKAFRDRLTPLLRNNPFEIAWWYSDKGPAAFNPTPDNKFREINYKVGQLYAQWYDGVEVRAAAVKVTNEAVIRQFMPHIFDQSRFLQTEEERITHFLMNPTLSGYTVDSFFETPWKDGLLYIDEDGKNHTLHEALPRLRATLAGIQTEKVGLSQDIRDGLRQKNVSEDIVMRAYISRIRNHMRAEGVSEMMLSGSCGGERVDIDSIEALLGTALPKPQELVTLYSTAQRLLTQTAGVSSEYRGGYNCPQCGRFFSGESGNAASWTSACSCKFKFRCKPEEKAA